MAREVVEQWWSSFRQMLQQEGIDLKNPYDLSRIIVANDVETPKDKNGNELFMMNLSVYDAVGIMKRGKFPYSYALMPTDAKGDYKNKRPSEDTSEWFLNNMKNLDNAGDALKEHLYEMAQNNKLLLSDPGPVYPNQDGLRAIRVSQNNQAVITESVSKLPVYMPQYFDSPDLTEYDRAKKRDIEDFCTVNNYEIEEYAAFQNRITTDTEMLQYRSFSIDRLGRYIPELLRNGTPDDKKSANNAMNIIKNTPENHERAIAAIGSAHPEWVNTKKKRQEYETLTEMMSVPKYLRTDEQKFQLGQALELDPYLAKYEKHLKRLTGCGTMEDVMKSGQVKNLNGDSLPSDDTRNFIRSVMRCVRSNRNGLLITDSEGHTRAYMGFNDQGIVKAAVCGENREALIHMLDIMSGEQENQSPAAVQLRKAVKKVRESNYIKNNNRDAIPMADINKEFNQLKQACENYCEEFGSIKLPTDEQWMIERAAEATQEMCDGILKGRTDVKEKIVQDYSNLFISAGNVSPSSYRDEIARLTRELAKTDRMLERDNEPYRQVKNALKELNDKTFRDCPETMTAEEMRKALKGVYNSCQHYMDEHQSVRDLSSRQLSRLKTMHRIMDLYDYAKMNVEHPDWQYKASLAGKIVQNAHIDYLTRSKGADRSSKTFFNARKAMLDHQYMTRHKLILGNSETFKDYLNTVSPEKKLKMDGQKVMKEYNNFVKARSNLIDEPAKQNPAVNNMNNMIRH